MTLREARDVASDERRAIHDASESVTKSRRHAKIVANDVPTLLELIGEYEDHAGVKLKVWQTTARGSSSEARNRISTVFSALLDRQATTISLQDFATEMSSYKPASGKITANGQVSRARAYLMPLLDWAANRGKFKKLGRGRELCLDVADLHEAHDPALDDPSIRGFRDRVLSQDEIKRILPLLVWPAPTCLSMRAAPIDDFRPVALRFMLLTLARREEVADMLWRDFDPNAGLWNKSYVKTTRGQARRQTLQLSDAAVALLKNLPHYESRLPGAFVFPNTVGGKLDNWPRIAGAIERESGTSGWHRHDLRRTSATLLQLLGVSDRVIGRVMGQNASSRDETVSKALEHYLVDRQITDLAPDLQKQALDKLAAVLDTMVKSIHPIKTGDPSAETFTP
jgi:integrase